MSQARAVAVLLSCAAVGATAEGITATYTYDEIAAGRDIHEGIYGSHGDGEFDEWRIHLGVAPGLDRIQVKNEVNGAPYPGPAAVETDRLINDPALPPQLGVYWVLGDYERGDRGWFYTLGLEYTRRDYKILYGLGADSQDLQLNALAVQVGMGYGVYLNPRVRYEFLPFATLGILWNEIDLIDLSIPAPEIRTAAGPLVEIGVRNALVWHPARTQAWHLGAALDYRSGYAQTIFNDEGEFGTLRSEIRLWWYGFGASVFYGAKF